MTDSAVRPIALVGLSGSGKSTLARLLAARLNTEWVDTDSLVEAMTGRSIPSIFAEAGEAAFRSYETEALRRALAGPARVLATGGGIVLHEENRALLQAHACVVWIDAPDQVLLQRLAAHDEERPLLSEDAPARLQRLRALRQDLYAGVATLRIDTGGQTPEAVVELIIQAIES
jgi:shikimate kinase